MRSPEETRDAWRRLNNPQSLDDWYLAIPLKEIRQCPEIIEEMTSCGMPPALVLRPFDNLIFKDKVSLFNFIDTLEKVHADVYNKAFVADVEGPK